MTKLIIHSTIVLWSHIILTTFEFHYSGSSKRSPSMTSSSVNKMNLGVEQGTGYTCKSLTICWIQCSVVPRLSKPGDEASFAPA